MWMLFGPMRAKECLHWTVSLLITTSDTSGTVAMSVGEVRGVVENYHPNRATLQARSNLTNRLQHVAQGNPWDNAACESLIKRSNTKKLPAANTAICIKASG